jgi:hypothetical protein
MGTAISSARWGPDSYNNGAERSRLLTDAAYALHNMPLGTTFNATVLTDTKSPQWKARRDHSFICSTLSCAGLSVAVWLVLP